MHPKDLFHASPARLACMPTLLVPSLAKIVTTMLTNPNPMLRNAFQSKKGSTNRVPQPKLSVQRVNQGVAATQRVKIARQERSKARPATPPVTLAPADGAIRATDPLVATPYHRGRTP